MQHTLQDGLRLGMSAVSGIHDCRKPNHVPENFDGLAEVMPQDWTPTISEKVSYRGKNGDVYAPRMCIGAWSWGDEATWNWDDSEFPVLQSTWEELLQKGLTFVDTAQAYGSGKSEKICGTLFAGLRRDDFIIQTKYYVLPQFIDIFHPKTSPLYKLEGSLKRLRLSYVDIYLVHGPIHIQSIPAVAKGMAECVDKGLTKCVGVANYDKEDMLKMRDELAKYNIPLALNQCEYSVLRRIPETSGLLKTCKDNGIVFQSYSSLAQGRLTAKYNSQNPPPKQYRFSSYDMKDVEPVQATLKKIADARGVPISAVALNYNMCKGISPLVGVRRPQQALDNSKAFGWRLTNEEIRTIDSVSFEGYTTSLWQQG
ncbi:Aldo/keto reductase [Periconia macrospinosa]|uniref:Aldo/keto reductase n=1 Tax=Periconia macrospinosa TaxID=97972 RepID=A0A2V1D670_9PLEO|nr:Aldo/keto reductase [Periconia macrospinosa]